jgi:hypothetical protein
MKTVQPKIIIETTETAANKIMDNLENMQRQTEKIGEIIAYLKKDEIRFSEGKEFRLYLQGYRSNSSPYKLYGI